VAGVHNDGRYTTRKKTDESFWSKVGFAAIDKLLIGGVIGLVALVASLFSDSLKAAWSLQEKDTILNARVKVYTDLHSGLIEREKRQRSY
jgi:hypothetical protein